MLTIISSSKYFPAGHPLCHPRQLLPAVPGSESICTVGSVQNSLLFNTLLCICGVKLWVYHLQAQHNNNSQGNSLSRYTFLTLAFLSWASFSSPPFLLLIRSCPSGGHVGSDSHSSESARPRPFITSAVGLWCNKCETEKERTRRCLISDKSAF